MDELRGLSDGLDVVLGAVIEEPDHRYFNASLYFSRGELVHVHRKVYLPTYGMFDEQRYFAAGGRFCRFKTRFRRAGPLFCEDIMHPSRPPTLQAPGGGPLTLPPPRPR